MKNQGGSSPEKHSKELGVDYVDFYLIEWKIVDKIAPSYFYEFFRKRGLEALKQVDH